MAVSFQQVMQKIQSITSTVKEDQEKLNIRRDHAFELWKKYANDNDILIRKVEQAKEIDQILRCALPADEPLDHFTQVPTPISPYTLIAADGSQVNPDRHAAILFSLVNIGLIAMKPGTGEASKIFTFTDIKLGNELYENPSLLSEDMVSLKRDLSERQKLLEVSNEFHGLQIALTDGPLEVWGLRQGFSDTYRQALETHLMVLNGMYDKGLVLAGVVDKPGANLVVRLLEIAKANKDELKNIKSFSPLRGVDDRWLFRTLPPGARSSIFGIQSSARNYYKGLYALYFFYLNTSMDDHPNIVRVEIPAWVATDQEKLDLLHASLIEQCRIMGFKPYPYILHRAHEVALVTYEDKVYVEQLLAHELRIAGMEIGEISSKQSAKDLPGRKRS